MRPPPPIPPAPPGPARATTTLSAPLSDLTQHFDAVASYLVLNDVEDYRGFAATLAAVLKPGGRLVLALNNPLRRRRAQPRHRLLRLGYGEPVPRPLGSGDQGVPPPPYARGVPGCFPRRRPAADQAGRLARRRPRSGASRGLPLPRVHASGVCLPLIGRRVGAPLGRVSRPDTSGWYNILGPLIGRQALSGAADA